LRGFDDKECGHDAAEGVLNLVKSVELCKK
jgi:hypothetical protein